MLVVRPLNATLPYLPSSMSAWHHVFVLPLASGAVRAAASHGARRPGGHRVRGGCLAVVMDVPVISTF